MYDSLKGEGTITGISAEREPDWAGLLETWGFDPDLYHVDPDRGVQVRTWEGFAKDNDGEIQKVQLWYVRATVKAGAPRDHAEIAKLCDEIRRHRPAKPPAVDTGRALVVALADWQTGKSEGGGSEALVARVLALHDAVPRRVRELKRLGRPVDRLVVAGMGDLVEGCDGHYAMQTFSVDLDRRGQVTVVRRLLLKLLESWSKLAPDLTVVAIPGNHGENRRNGKAFTAFGDNDDTAVFEQVADVLASNPERYGHVRFVIPRDELTATLEVNGTVLGFAHGHQARGGTGPQKKLEAWWKGQALGRTPIGEVDLLVSGHYHHLQVVEFTAGRTWLQCPSLDGGSRWWTDSTGSHSTPGTLTFTVSADGWGDLAVL